MSTSARVSCAAPRATRARSSAAARTAGREVVRLREEVAQLHQALVSRPVIDQAMGVAATLASCDTDTAWRILVRVSQNTNTKVRVVAAQLVAGCGGGPALSPSAAAAFTEAMHTLALRPA